LEKNLHIVCLDIPYPPDYGGLFDLYYKLQHLKENGISIHLHCFHHHRAEQPDLLRYCKTVHYYKRQKGWKSISLNIPYIVNTRNDNGLMKNLSKDNYPVLLEGIHCTRLLYENKLPNRRVIIRLHNVEFDYYAQLAEKTTDLFKKIYYSYESHLLKKYEKKIAQQADHIVCVSPKDEERYKKLFGVTNIDHLPVFVPWQKVTSKPGTGAYCLYQGNLSVIENEIAAIWLIQNVFNDLNIPFIIAGKNPTNNLKKRLGCYSHISLVENPSFEKMEGLIGNAQINLLPSFSNTGIKLKLLHAVFGGRFCIVNNDMIAGAGVESACYMANNADDFKRIVKETFHQPFTSAQISLRQTLLERQYDNKQHAAALIQMIYGV
jgi:glycosyltransferase involved in cell wall biosynthesis